MTNFMDSEQLKTPKTDCVLNVPQDKNESTEFSATIKMLHITEPWIFHMLHLSSQPNPVLPQNKHDTINHILEDQWMEFCLGVLQSPTRLGIWLWDLGLLNKYNIGHCGLSAASRHKLVFTSRHYTLLTATDNSTLLNYFPGFLFLKSI